MTQPLQPWRARDAELRQHRALREGVRKSARRALPSLSSGRQIMTTVNIGAPATASNVVPLHSSIVTGSIAITTRRGRGRPPRNTRGRGVPIDPPN